MSTLEQSSVLHLSSAPDGISPLLHDPTDQGPHLVAVGLLSLWPEPKALLSLPSSKESARLTWRHLDTKTPLVLLEAYSTD